MDSSNAKAGGTLLGGDAVVDVRGFGIGSVIDKPGDAPEVVTEKARALMAVLG